MINSPEQIFSEYKKAAQYKSGIGSRGIVEQTRVNERFFVGDQWYGAKCGNDRPLVRHNLIKRIGDYKMSVLLSKNTDIVYTADGVANTISVAKSVKAARQKMAAGESAQYNDRETEIATVMSALNDYQRATAERLKLNTLCEKVLRDAYISGTGVIYTYWEAGESTGLYADKLNSTAIKGDIKSEVIDIENVYFGDPSITDIQQQPYIILVSVRNLDEIRRYAERFGASTTTLKDIKSDGVRNENTVTVFTKLQREWDEESGDYKIYAKMVTERATVRDKWDIGVRLYPLSVFCWEPRKNCAYGDSEITYLIPNQIAVNRMITAGVWSAMSTGMPTLVVNGDVVDGEITNDPGQIIKVFGTGEEIANALKYVCPPDYSGNIQSVVSPLIENTLAQSGANPAALGDVDPTNTSAIIALRNAAFMPLKMLQNRFHGFLEEISRIWAEFWITQYGNRRLKITDEHGTWYMDFDGEKYRDLVVRATAYVSAEDEYDSSLRVEVLDRLLSRGEITPEQYLKRLPQGLVSDTDELIREMRGEA